MLSTRHGSLVDAVIKDSLLDSPEAPEFRARLSTGNSCLATLEEVGDLKSLPWRACVPVLIDYTWSDSPATLSAAVDEVVCAAVHIRLSQYGDLHEANDRDGAGRDVPPDAPTLTWLLSELQAHLGRELLLMGVGPAGNEVLRQGAAIGRTVSCLVWSLTPERPLPDDSWARRTVALHDTADPQLTETLGARAKACGYVHRGRGLHTTASGHCAIVVDVASAGGSIRDLVSLAVAELSDPLKPARAVFEAFQSSGFINISSTIALPRDLRHEAGKLLSDARIGSDTVSDGLQHVRLSGFRSGVGGMFFEFRVVDSDGSRELVSPVVTSSPEAVLSVDTSGLLEVAVFDGFGHRIQTFRAAWPMRPCDENRTEPAVFVYGSCVTRDAFALEEAPPLADYIARSPLGSAFSAATPARDLIRLEDNPSAFQRRMVEVDFDKTLGQLLADTPFDLLVLDFIDERLGLVRTSRGYVTYSPEARVCGLEPTVSDVVPSESNEHLDAFSDGLKSLLQVTSPDRILVNRVYWSEKTDCGTPLSDLESIRRSNRLLDAKYAIAAEHGLTFIFHRDEEFVADPNHRWGLSPFHYSPPIYRSVLRGIHAAHRQLVR